MQTNLILIGMPGAGKSTVGVVLAKILGMDFIDADLLIQKKHGRTLQSLINEQGSLEFIALENEVLCQIEAENTVIATGGSAVYSEAGMRHLANIGQIIYLRVSFEEMKRRLGNLDERGVVFRQDTHHDLRALYDERTCLYAKYADITVDADSLSITEVARKAISLLEA